MNLTQHNALVDIHAKAQPKANDGEPKPGYKMFGGFFVNVHHPAGTIRRGVNDKGESWATRMHNDYGELPGSVGCDDDPVDCYLGPKPNAKLVHVIHMNDADGNYDEDKAMIGFPSQQDAIDAFGKHYPTGTSSIRSVTTHKVAGFRQKVRLGKKNAELRMLHASKLPGHDADGTQSDADMLMEYRSFGNGEPKGANVRRYQRGDNDRVVHVTFKKGNVHKSTLTYADGHNKGEADTRHGWKGLYEIAQAHGD